MGGKRAVNPASIESYWMLEEEGGLTRRQRQVYEAIRENNSMTNKEIAAYLGWPINSVTGRVRELVQIGKVYSIGRVYDDKTRRRVNEWAVIMG